MLTGLELTTPARNMRIGDTIVAPPKSSSASLLSLVMLSVSMLTPITPPTPTGEDCVVMVILQ